MHDIAQVPIDLARPLLFNPYDVNRSTGAFILIGEATNHTVAAGMTDGDNRRVVRRTGAVSRTPGTSRPIHG